MVRLLAIWLPLLSASVSWADTCPLPPSSISPSIISSVSYDRKSQLYTYRYEVRNGRDAPIAIKSFILQMIHSPSGLVSPTHWISDFLSLSYMPFHVLWNSIPSSKYKSADIAPGGRLSGFGFQSAQPPGLIQYYAQGRTGVPASTPPALDAPNDEPIPNCPDWDFESPRFKTLVTGITTGPLPPKSVSVAIRVREDDGIRPLPAFSPAHPTGKTGVLVLASDDFDPSQILVSSIKFGPDDAAPISSQLITTHDDADRDTEREEWEKLSRGLDDDYNRSHGREKVLKKQNLLLVFNLSSLGVQCVLDKAILLTGQTQSGMNIIGGVSTRLIGCDIRHPGKHHKNPSASNKRRKINDP